MSVTLAEKAKILVETVKDTVKDKIKSHKDGNDENGSPSKNFPQPAVFDLLTGENHEYNFPREYSPPPQADFYEDDRLYD